MIAKLASLTVTVRVDDVPTFLRAAREAGWSAVDTGKRHATPEGDVRDAILVLTIPVQAGAPEA